MLVGVLTEAVDVGLRGDSPALRIQDLWRMVARRAARMSGLGGRLAEVAQDQLRKTELI